MFRVSKADVVWLAILCCVDLSVYAWWEKDRTIPLDPESIAALVDTEQTPTATALATPDTTTTDADNEQTNPDNGFWEHAYGEYIVKTVKGSSEEEDFILHVFKAGQLVFSTNSHRYFDPEAQAVDSNETSRIPKPLTDVTGDGAPNLIVSAWSGGAHCCATYYIFELGDEFRLVDTIHADHDAAHFEDLDGDGIPEVQMQDWQYAYVFTSFGSSPAPPITLRYTNGKYQVDPELMFAEPPTEEEYAGLVSEVREVYSHPPEGADEVIPPNVWGGEAVLWDTMLKLTYNGHVDLAMKLFNDCWQAEWKDKDAAENQYWKLVGSSPHGRALVEAQGYELPEVTSEEEEVATD